jgi:hypothetical protein
MFELAKPYGVYCEDHGLQFITQAQFDKDDQTCPKPFCNAKAEFEQHLHKAALVDGCTYCKRAPIVPSGSNRTFWYDEKAGKVFCHAACFKCFRRKCTVKGCAAQAKISVWLVFAKENIEYVIPTAFCSTHSHKMPPVPDDAIWQFVCSNFEQAKQPIPDRQSCKIELRPY